MSAINIAMEQLDKQRLEESFNKYVEKIDIKKKLSDTEEALRRCRNLLASEKELNERLIIKINELELWMQKK